MLIINADDWGYSDNETDAIAACFGAKAVSSATGMVCMTGSERAAAIGRDQKLPIGLHLNFTQPFDAPGAPVGARDRQRLLCAYFSRWRRRRFFVNPDPRVRRLVADGIRDQLEMFCEAYETEPTHMDGHHGVHLCPDVLFSPALARSQRMRGPIYPAPGVRRIDVMRSTRRAVVKHRFVTPARFWIAHELAHCYGNQTNLAIPIADAATMAADVSVEIMTHPGVAEELAILRSDEWLSTLADAPLSPYSALASNDAAQEDTT